MYRSKQHCVTVRLLGKVLGMPALVVHGLQSQTDALVLLPALEIGRTLSGGEGGNWWVNQKSSILSGSVISFHIWKCMAVQRWKGFPPASPGPAPHASSLQSSFLRQQPPLHPHSISARISIPYKLLESTLSQSPQYSTHILGPQKIII